LGLTESVAYGFITVARKARKVPALSQAVRTNELSVAKASRIVATITSENAEELIEFAKAHTTGEVERKLNKGARKNLDISLDPADLLRRAQDLNPQASLDDVLKLVLGEYLNRHDPVAKAKCATTRVNAKHSARAEPAKKPHGRKRLAAPLIHAVNIRDGCQCTFRDSSGRRCENRRFLHTHHVRPIARGGTNDLKNLTTFCSEHHALVHQLGFESDGQVNWLRSPQVAYQAH